MMMGINGKDHRRIYKSIMFCKTKEVEGPNFLKKGGVTYVSGHEVSWVFSHVNTTRF